MGDEGAQIAITWGEQTGCFERILKALVLDLNRLMVRVDDLENNHGSQIVTIKEELGTLVANVQGFETQEETLENQRQERENLRQIMPLCGFKTDQQHSEDPKMIKVQAQSGDQSANPQNVENRSSPEPTLDSRNLIHSSAIEKILQPHKTIQLESKRLRAKQHWRWALMKVRMQKIRGRIPMTSAILGRRNSIVFRLQEAEGLIDKADYSLRHLSAHAGPDKINSAMRMLKWLNGALVGGAEQNHVNSDGIFCRLLNLENKMNIVHELATTANTRSKTVEIYCERFRHGLREAADQAASAFEDASHLRNKVDTAEEMSRDKLPHARRQAVAFTSALRNTCFAAMRSRHIAALPGGKSLIQDRLNPVHHQLDIAKGTLHTTLDSAGDVAQWRAVVLKTARYLYSVLHEDTLSQNKINGAAFEGEPQRASTLIDVPIDLVGEQAYRVEKDYDAEFIVDVVGNVLNARELVYTPAPLFMRESRLNYLAG